MKKLIVAFSILFVIFIITRVVFEFYIYAVPVFAVLLTPLTWFSVITGVLTVLVYIMYSATLEQARPHF